LEIEVAIFVATAWDKSGEDRTRLATTSFIVAAPLANTERSTLVIFVAVLGTFAPFEVPKKRGMACGLLGSFDGGFTSGSNEEIITLDIRFCPFLFSS